MNNPSMLIQVLDQGFSVHNFRRMVELCMQMAREANEPLAFYALACIFSDLLESWDERPVLKDEADEVEFRLSSDVKKVLTCIESGQEAKEVYGQINNLLRKHLRNI